MGEGKGRAGAATCLKVAAIVACIAHVLLGGRAMRFLDVYHTPLLHCAYRVVMHALHVCEPTIVWRSSVWSGCGQTPVILMSAAGRWSADGWHACSPALQCHAPGKLPASLMATLAHTPSALCIRPCCAAHPLAFPPYSIPPSAPLPQAPLPLSLPFPFHMLLVLPRNGTPIVLLPLHH